MPGGAPGGCAGGGATRHSDLFREDNSAQDPQAPQQDQQWRRSQLWLRRTRAIKSEAGCFVISILPLEVPEATNVDEVD